MHHQSDVGEASYAAVPALVEMGRRVPARGWNFYGLLAIIEVERHAHDNPPLPAWLVEEYRAAWEQLLPLALDELRVTRDPYVVRTALTCVALAKGETPLGALLAGLDASEFDEMLDEKLAWSEQYNPRREPRIV